MTSRRTLLRGTWPALPAPLMALTTVLVLIAGGPWWVAVPPVVGLFLLGFCWAAFGDDNLRAARQDDSSDA